MNTHRTDSEWPPDAPAPDGPSRAEGDNAPPDPSEPPAGDANHSAPAPPVDPSDPLPAPAIIPPAPPPAVPDPPPTPVWRDFPVASVMPPVAPLLHPPIALTPLEDRILRLEAELAQLRTRPAAADAPGSPGPDPAMAVVRKPGTFWGDVRRRLLASSGPAAAPAPRPEGLASMVPPGVRRTWLIFDALTELRAMYWMFFDPRYRLSWMGRLAPLVIVALILTSWLWVPATSVPILGFVIEKLADLVLAYILFKLLSHEARRYRETAPDLPPSLRQ